ncbi:MAG TPA: RsmE family RNA methyltransferase, partial [Oscillatoriaceae cyanobacterium]
MPRYFIAPDQLQETRVVLSAEDSHHFARVLRNAVGAKFTAVTGGRAYEAMAEEVDGRRVVGQIVSSEPVAVPPVAITLCQALPKGDKMELVVQKATELGVAQVLPLRAARCVVQLQGARAEARVERWQSIAEEAAEQSEREGVPRVLPVTDLKQHDPGQALTLVLSERSA